MRVFRRGFNEGLFDSELFSGLREVFVGCEILAQMNQLFGNFWAIRIDFSSKLLVDQSLRGSFPGFYFKKVTECKSFVAFKIILE